MMAPSVVFSRRTRPPCSDRLVLMELDHSASDWKPPIKSHTLSALAANVTETITWAIFDSVPLPGLPGAASGRPEMPGTAAILAPMRLCCRVDSAGDARAYRFSDRKIKELPCAWAAARCW